ncbi:MAG: helix-turn-helix domain-containing protein [Rhodobacteraceae bacterium]|jgi:transcriptional regulator with XRE-family HTH domain|nr:helix-turn-helix domain-containing protein [Paracoccaceae bacterium]
MTLDVSARLRALREENGWTVADMAERTGIPKRTLEKYMLRTGGSLPGLDALVSLSRGLGVSLDWLVFGEEIAGETMELVATRAAAEVSAALFETLVREHRERGASIVQGEEVLRLTVDEWSLWIGETVGEKARELVSEGASKEKLLTWRAAKREQAHEFFMDRFQKMLAEAKT